MSSRDREATQHTTALDAALAAVDAAIPAAADESSQVVVAKCRGLIRGYDARWKNSGYVTLCAERILFAPLVNPETSAKSRTFDVGGKLDVIATYEGRNVLIDHKTSSQDIADPDSPYWRQLVVEGQPSHYGILGWANGCKFESTIWDVIRRPSISPKKLTKAEIASVVSTGRYFGDAVDDATCLLFSQSATDRETLSMYESRLAHDCTHERPDWYFQRRPIPRVDHELIEYAGQLWDISQDIISTRQHNRHHKNSGACMLYGTPCKYLGICSGHDTPDSGNWREKSHTHAELKLSDAESGREVLTNSRVRCFQTCKRKHYYEYECCIEQVDEEEREVLFFGTTIHLALESWWNFYKAPQTGV